SPVAGLGRSSSQTKSTPTWGWSASMAAVVRAVSLMESLASRTTTSSRSRPMSSTAFTIFLVDSTAKPLRVSRNCASRRNSSSRRRTSAPRGAAIALTAEDLAKGVNDRPEQDDEHRRKDEEDQREENLDRRLLRPLLSE